MSNIIYYSLWLVAALIAIALLSAMIVRRLHIRETRRQRALELLDALSNYSDWAAAQRRAAFFHGGDDAAGPLEKARDIEQGWFPELASDVNEILAVHNGLVDFLWNQQQLRFSDPERWLESDHDARFLELWRRHLFTVEGVQTRLRSLARVQEADQDEHQLA